MKTKVILYDHTGNNVISRHKELTPFAENIYTTFIHKDSCGIDTNDIFGIVFAIKGVYFIPEYCNRDRLADSNYKNRLIDFRRRWTDHVKQQAAEGQYIRLLEIRVFEELGEETTPLRQAREAMLKKRDAENEARRRHDKEAAQRKEQEERQRLDECKCRFLTGGTITGEEFISIAKRDGFAIHIRTAGTLRKRIAELNRNRAIWYYRLRGKAAPDVTGCRKAIKGYLSFSKTRETLQLIHKQHKAMKATDYFKQTIQSYLQRRAQEDELFAPRYANPKKNIDDCITFILNYVKQSGCNGFADDEIYSLALHYYDEDDIDIGKPLTNCKVVVNHTIELSEAEKAEARRQAMQKATDEAYRKITQGKNKTKKTETTTQSSLFNSIHHETEK